MSGCQDKSAEGEIKENVWGELFISPVMNHNPSTIVSPIKLWEFMIVNVKKYNQLSSDKFVMIHTLKSKSSKSIRHLYIQTREGR